MSDGISMDIYVYIYIYTYDRYINNISPLVILSMEDINSYLVI